ncbi:MAG: sulfurtransferase complex subunit TusD [Pseudomonadales bacterium]
MKFAISVHGDPEMTRSPATALAFTKAALTAGHEVPSVFFYHDAVRTGCSVGENPATRAALLRGWVDLALSYGTDLMVCVAAAQTRGIHDAEQAKRLGETPNLHPAFQLVGLGQFTEMIMGADRLVTFDG